MLNVSFKGNVRCNGVAETSRGGMVHRNSSMPPLDRKSKCLERLKCRLVEAASSDVEDPYQFSEGDRTVYGRLHEQASTATDTKRSIIDSKMRTSSGGKPVPGVLRARRGVHGGTQHEGSVQRIRERRYGIVPFNGDCEEVERKDVWKGALVYQHHWFSRELELLDGVAGGRDARLELTRAELRRRLHQMRRGQAVEEDEEGARLGVGVVSRSSHRIPMALPAPSPPPPPIPSRSCMLCRRRAALPCTAHCALHIMASQDQVLFDYCTAKFADNTQCSVPVVDVQHELPLCAEHARKRDNYNKMCAEVHSSRAPRHQTSGSGSAPQHGGQQQHRRKVKPSAMIRPQRRSKKRKRPTPVVERQQSPAAPPPNSAAVTSTAAANPSGGDDPLEHALVTQASRLLEETDFTTVLNQIPADEFNDLFSDRNGEYEPSVEETEELERALRAVDNDVKSLEKLSQTHAGLLDQLLADDTLTAELPDVVFHTAYVTPTPQ